MDAFLQTPLTPDQLAAVQAGGGFAQVEDPNIHRVYFLIEQAASPTIDDAYVREKIAEADAEREYVPLDMPAIKAEFHGRFGLILMIAVGNTN